MPGTADLSLLAAGRTAEVYAWELDVVLKLFYDWVPRDWVVHEAGVSRHVADAGISTARALGELELEGRHGILYTRVDGVSMLADMARRPWRVAAFARRFAELHHAIHRQSASGLPRLHDSLRTTIETVDALPARTKAAALEAVEELPDGDALCHFDFHPGQVLLARGQPVVIDWMTAKQGSPAADVARSVVILTVAQPPFAPNRLQNEIVKAAKSVFSRRYVAQYRRLEPTMETREIERWMLPVAAARLREDIAGERARLFDIIEAGHGGLVERRALGSLGR